MNNALLYIGGFLVMVLAALFAVPYFVDWNSYRGVFEEEATRILGRDVRVGGDVNLRLLPAPYVRFEKLKIAEPDDAGGENFFRAESFTMWLSVPPLLKGVLEANKIELHQPALKLVANPEGGGNWQSLAINTGLVPFVPKDVALQSVTLVDGSLSLNSARQGEIGRIEGINGELAADGLEGPYKFSGKLLWGGKPRRVRVSTARRDRNGDIRFKTSVRALDTLNSYVLSGHVSDIMERPRIEGDLTAFVHMNLAIPEDVDDKSDNAAAETAPEPDISTDNSPLGQGTKTQQDLDTEIPDRPALLPESASTGIAPFELRTKVTGGIDKLNLSEITLSLDQEGAPQLISGEATVNLSERTHLDVSLSSSWLDLDKLAATGDTKAVPADAARRFFEALARQLPDVADTNASLTIDQVTLGGEAMSRVRLVATRAGGPLELKEVRASLPGGAHLSLEGVLAGAQDNRSFDGLISIDGHNLSRFLSWSTSHAAVVPSRADGAFAFEGRLNLSRNSIAFTEATAELAGMPFTGMMKLKMGKRKRIALSIEGYRIDTGNLWPGSLEAEQLAELVVPSLRQTTEGNEQQEPDAALWPAIDGMDLELRLRAAELVDGPRALKNVDADVTLEGGKLSIPVLKFATQTGLIVDIKGEVQNMKAAAKGDLHGTVNAPSADAFSELLRLVRLDSSEKGKTAEFEALVPFKAAGTFETGKRTTTSADLKFDGTAANGRIIAKAELDGGWKAWSTAPAEFSLSVSNRKVLALAQNLLGITNGAEAESDPQPGRLLFHAAGNPAKGLVSVAAIEADGQVLDYKGNIIYPAKGTPRLTGNIDVRNGNAGRLLRLAGIPIGGVDRTRMEGTIGISASGGRIEFAPHKLKAGNTNVDGKIALIQTDDGLHNIDADLEVDQATVPGLVGFMLENEPIDVLESNETESNSATNEKPSKDREDRSPTSLDAALFDIPGSVWPASNFDRSIFGNLRGKAKVRLASLMLEPGLTMTDATIDTSFEPGRISVDKLSARSLGGRLTSNLAFEKAPAGVELKGEVAIDISSGDSSEKTSSDKIGDIASFELDFSGRALAPSTLITSLTGKGNLVVGDVTLTGNTPKAVSQVAEAALQGKGVKQGEELANAFKAAVKDGNLPLGKLKLPATLAAGRLSLDPIKIETRDGIATATSSVDLSGLRIQTAWQIEPKVFKAAPPQQLNAGSTDETPPRPKGERVLLPPLTVTYAGKLRDLSNLEPIVATAALENELSARKLERAADEFERLRKLDEQRAKADLERQRALEAERAKQLELEQAPWQPLEPGEEGAGAVFPDGQATAAAETPAESDQAAEPLQEPKPVTKRRKKKRPKDVWKPFQIQPY